MVYDVSLDVKQSSKIPLSAQKSLTWIVKFHLLAQYKVVFYVFKKQPICQCGHKNAIIMIA